MQWLRPSKHRTRGVPDAEPFSLFASLWYDCICCAKSDARNPGYSRNNFICCIFSPGWDEPRKRDNKKNKSRRRLDCNGTSRAWYDFYFQIRNAPLTLLVYHAALRFCFHFEFCDTVLYFARKRGHRSFRRNEVAQKETEHNMVMDNKEDWLD